MVFFSNNQLIVYYPYKKKENGMNEKRKYKKKHIKQNKKKLEITLMNKVEIDCLWVSRAVCLSFIHNPIVYIVYDSNRMIAILSKCV